MKKYKICVLKWQGIYKLICKVTGVSFCPQIQSSVPLSVEELDLSVFISRRKTNEAVFQELKAISRYRGQLRPELK